MNKQNHPMYEETERLLAFCNSDNVLDIGCGNGYVLKMFAERYTCDFVGIDVSESILKSASQKNRKYVQSGNMRFECCGADKMAFSDASFDKAYTINTVYFWEDLSNVLEEVKRILKSGGTFINALYTNETLSRFSHTQFGYRRFSQDELINAARAVGFKVAIEPIMDGAAYCIVSNNVAQNNLM